MEFIFELDSIIGNNKGFSNLSLTLEDCRSRFRLTDLEHLESLWNAPSEEIIICYLVPFR